MDEPTIWTRAHRLDKARMEERERLMEEYDKNVYWPARKALIAECEAKGHQRGKFHDNGLGWQWYYCSQCGTPFEKECYLKPSQDEEDNE
jgi:hypothetical protein